MTTHGGCSVRPVGRILFRPGSTGIFSVGGGQTRGGGSGDVVRGGRGGPSSSGSSADQRGKTCSKQLCYCGGRRRNVMELQIRSDSVQRRGSPAGRAGPNLKVTMTSSKRGGGGGGGTGHLTGGWLGHHWRTINHSQPTTSRWILIDGV